MSARHRSRKLIAAILSIITIIAALQILGITPRFASADNNLTFQLKPLPTSTESSSATATVQVNIDSGGVLVALKNMSPGVMYTALFVASSSSISIGDVSVDEKGNGEFEGTLSSGAYVGQFALSKEHLIEFVSDNLSLSIGTTSSATTSLVSNSTASSTVSLVSTTSQSLISSSEQVQFLVEPQTVSVAAGDFANFNIIATVSRGGGNILLVARGVPDDSVAIFTPQSGVANPTFHSTLYVIVSGGTTAGSYGITVSAIIDGVEYDSQITLQVTSSSGTPTVTSTNLGGLGLSITTDTDARIYQSNSTVILSGRVTDNTGSAVNGATVSVQVDSSQGKEVYSQDNLQTDSAGLFQVEFTLPVNATPGTYTAFTSTNKAGLTTATTHTTFVVETSSTPSVIITDVYAADTTGSRSAVFASGQTVVVWVIVENSGAPFQGVIWVQIRDPNGTPVFVQFQISTLNTGATVKVGIGFTMTSNLQSGVYTANAFVSDKLISQGGTFLASGTAEFALTG